MLDDLQFGSMDMFEEEMPVREFNRGREDTIIYPKILSLYGIQNDQDSINEAFENGIPFFASNPLEGGGNTAYLHNWHLKNQDIFQ